jgi:hypothetical protein
LQVFFITRSFRGPSVAALALTPGRRALLGTVTAGDLVVVRL